MPVERYYGDGEQESAELLEGVSQMRQNSRVRESRDCRCHVDVVAALLLALNQLTGGQCVPSLCRYYLSCVLYVVSIFRSASIEIRRRALALTVKTV